MMEGWHGWDEYAPFYDWENARTLGGRDVRFWERLAAGTGGRALELGCGTGRVSLPMARRVQGFVGIDRSDRMLARARLRFRRAGLQGPQAALIRGDIRTLPFSGAPFDLVAAPYGVLQSMLTDRDLAAALRSMAMVVAPGGYVGIDLVPDVPRWREYRRRVQLSGRRAGRSLRLIESVRQDEARRVTIFDQEYVEGRGATRRVHRFSIAFRTLPVPEMVRRVEGAGLRVEAALGDYDGGPWDPRAAVWILLARRPV